MLKKWYGYIPHQLKNKFFVTFLVFTIWVLFFDNNDILYQLDLKVKLEDLKEEKSYYKEQVVELEKNLSDLLNNNDQLEKFAREKYLMKKEDEDIFVIVIED